MIITDFFCTLLFRVPEFRAPEPQKRLTNPETLIKVNIYISGNVKT